MHLHERLEFDADKLQPVGSHVHICLVGSTQSGLPSLIDQLNNTDLRVQTDSLISLRIHLATHILNIRTSCPTCFTTLSFRTRLLLDVPFPRSMQT